MLSFEVRRQAHVAGGAVEEVVPAPDPADAAAITVELLFLLVVEQLALEAEVLEQRQGHRQLLQRNQLAGLAHLAKHSATLLAAAPDLLLLAAE